MRLKLGREWELGARIDGGGFGQVYAATSMDGVIGQYVVKLVPKLPGTQRELLFIDLPGVRNVVPIIDSGETKDSWVLVMPRADKSLRHHTRETGQAFDVEAALPILTDIVTALVDLAGRVVHRDLKPENILLLNGKWCLADFGISRYAEATTAPDTQKYAWSYPYAAPERWRGERATGAADIYALGIIAFELLASARPFTGPNEWDYREQHLQGDPGLVQNANPGLAALVAECLYKSAAARPGPQNILARLAAIAEKAPSSRGLAKLQQANMNEVARQGEAGRQQSVARSEMDRRQELFRDAAAAFRRIGEELKSAIIENASTAALDIRQDGSWTIRINDAELLLSSAEPSLISPGTVQRRPINLNVIGFGSVSVRVPQNRHGYEGRSHSLWFCDAMEISRYAWFETAFMYHPLMGQSSSMAPFASQPGEDIAAKALSPGLSEYQLAWPFTPLVLGDLAEFVDRWTGWLADATQGRLNIPSTMPERPTQWRR
jgi:serine/threonine-protein kinase